MILEKQSVTFMNIFLSNSPAGEPVVNGAHHRPLFEPMGVEENAHGLVQAQEVEGGQQRESVDGMFFAHKCLNAI